MHVNFKFYVVRNTLYMYKRGNFLEYPPEEDMGVTNIIPSWCQVKIFKFAQVAKIVIFLIACHSPLFHLYCLNDLGY